MTTLLPSFPCWPPSNLMDLPERPLSTSPAHMLRESCPSASSSLSTTASSSPSTSPRSLDAALMSSPMTACGSLSSDMPLDTYHSLDYAAGVSPAQLYALQIQHQSYLQRQLMYHKLASPAPLLPHQQLPSFPPNFAISRPSPIVAPQALPAAITVTSPLSPSDPLNDLPESLRQAKRKRNERSMVNGEVRADEDSDDDSTGSAPSKRFKSVPSAGDLGVSETVLSDITDLLSLPQKEAAQRLGISESMLCKRFKECTRRKWPFRYLRKIEKTISSLQSQKEVEPLSPEDQDRLDELLKQRLECLAPVKIRITKSPSPISCGRSPIGESDSATTMEDDSDSDTPFEGDVVDYETEAIEQLIKISRASTPHLFFAPQFVY